MKVLFARFSSFGDCILTTGIIKHFKSCFPHIHAGVLTSTDFAQVYEGLSFVDKIHAFDRKKSAGDLRKFALSELKEYTHIIDLHSSLRSRSLKLILKADFFRYKKHSSKRRKFVKNKKPVPELTSHVVEKYAEPLQKAFNLGYKNIEKLRPSLMNYDTDTIKDSVLIHPYASKSTKEWPFFAELAEKLVSEDYRVTIAGTGNFPEIEGVENMSGKTDITGLFKLISQHETVITTDSGPMHAAVALNKKLVAIFGSTTREFGFFPLFKDCIVVENEGVECRPCDVHGLDECPLEHFSCMKGISTSKVFEAFLSLQK